ncbi:VOC family protein [Solwaraspora sp. WMMD1047]|uniref:VOC family protein n=1 Tax=Solwaraspora sp. WMMD1047 TaxID=3016102 RepID=UPI002417332E|nr:VOC family protein [Solwaraspora sp. WMMD1047]MDG4834347.1 VOC family protein [Solwaraspora sp. WMMD1047]
MANLDNRLRPARLERLTVVVDDIEESMTNYGLILGVDQWDLFEDDSRIGELTVQGMPSTASWRSAVGSCPSGQVTFELVQPTSGLSLPQLFRARHRTGIMQLNFAVDTPAELARVAAFFAERSAPVAQRYVRDGAWECVTFDTTALLGYLVHYQAPLRADAPAPGPDRHCDVSQTYSRPGAMTALDIPRLHHIGVVVRDVLGTVARHASVFDVDRWNFINWRREHGRLETPFYRGRPVDHEYLTGRAFDFQGFGFEVIQPTYGPSHYRDDYLDVVGEGIHHLLIAFPSGEDRWAETIEWLESVNVPLVMGSEMRGGSGRFYYLDSREMLGGWVIEASFPRAGRPVVGPINDFSIDYRAHRAE